MNVLTVNLLFTTFVFWIAARLYVLPKVKQSKPATVMLPILLLHGLRNLGLMFLTPGGVHAGMPAAFARPAAYGDLLAAILAVLAIPAVVSGSKSARWLVLLFNLEGTIDLLNAIVLANAHDAATYMGAAYWIPGFWVPSLLVTHYVTFQVLRHHWSASAWTRVGTTPAATSRTNA